MAWRASAHAQTMSTGVVAVDNGPTGGADEAVPLGSELPATPDAASPRTRRKPSRAHPKKITSMYISEATLGKLLSTGSTKAY